MHILYHHRIASKDGQFVHIEEIIRALKDQGHSIDVVSPSISEKSEFGDDAGFISKLKEKLPKALYEIMELGYGGIIAFKLLKSILKQKPDIIYERYNLYQPVGVFIAKMLNIPVLLEVNAPLKEERERFYGSLGMPGVAKGIEDWTWKNADAALPVTNVLAQHLRKAGVRESKIHVIHNGIRTSTLNRMDEINHLNESQVSKEITIGFVGFMHLTCGVDKAIDVIADAQSNLDDVNVNLVCVGDGNVLPSLVEKAKSRNIESAITFTGMLSREDVFKHICTFDITLQPDVTEYASPLKMFEYMAAQSLIVAPSSSNIKEILNDNSALFFEKDVQGDFERVLMDAISGFNTHKSKGVARRKIIDEKGFTWEANAKRIMAIAQDIQLSR